MKQQIFLGSRKFWMALAAIFGAFILFSVVFCAIINPFQKLIVAEQSLQVVEQSEKSADDNSYEAIKGRVDDVNGNYGQSIKSAYYGENSTMRQFMQQRIFFSGLKSTLIIILIVMVILLVLIKGFNLRLFKKRLLEGETAVVSSENKVPEQKQEKDEKKPEKAFAKKDSLIAQKKEEDEDVQEVADSCQLP